MVVYLLVQRVLYIRFNYFLESLLLVSFASFVGSLRVLDLLEEVLEALPGGLDVALCVASSASFFAVFGLPSFGVPRGLEFDGVLGVEVELVDGVVEVVEAVDVEAVSSLGLLLFPSLLVDFPDFFDLAFLEDDLLELALFPVGDVGGLFWWLESSFGSISGSGSEATPICGSWPTMGNDPLDFLRRFSKEDLNWDEPRISSRDRLRCNFLSKSIDAVGEIDPCWGTGEVGTSISGRASFARSSCFTSSKVAFAGILRARANWD